MANRRISGEHFPEDELHRMKLRPAPIKIPDRKDNEKRPPSPGSPVKRYVEHYKRLSRDTSSDSMFPESRDEMLGGWL